MERATDTLPQPAFSSGTTPAHTPLASKRIAGLDIALALAIFGMVGAHIMTQARHLTWNPNSWMGIIDGRSAILFAVLAGVSLAMMTGRDVPVTGRALYETRVRVGLRGLIIFVIGGLLTMFAHQFAVVLEFYGVALILSLPFIGWKSRRLLSLGIGILVLIPVLRVVMNHSVEVWSKSAPGNSVTWRLLVDGPNPVFLWLGFLLIGLWVGRQRLESAQVALRLAAVGAVITFAVYGAGEFFESRNGINQQQSEERAAAENTEADAPNAESADASSKTKGLKTTDHSPNLVPATQLPPAITSCQTMPKGMAVCGSEESLKAAAQHGIADKGDAPEAGKPERSLRDDMKLLGTWKAGSWSPFENVGSAAFAVMVVGLCLLIPHAVGRVMSPIAAVGSMALTVYALQVMAFVWYKVPTAHGTRDFLIFCAVSVLAAWIWQRIFGQGPVERALDWASRKVGTISRPAPTAQHLAPAATPAD